MSPLPTLRAPSRTTGAGGAGGVGGGEDCWLPSLPYLRFFRRACRFRLRCCWLFRLAPAFSPPIPNGPAASTPPASPASRLRREALVRARSNASMCLASIGSFQATSQTLPGRESAELDVVALGGS